MRIEVSVRVSGEYGTPSVDATVREEVVGTGSSLGSASEVQISQLEDALPRLVSDAASRAEGQLNTWGTAARAREADERAAAGEVTS